MPRPAIEPSPVLPRHSWVARSACAGLFVLAASLAPGNPVADSLNLTLPAKLLRLNRTIHSDEAETLLIQVLAQVADLTQDGTPAEMAIEQILGQVPANDWLTECLLTNWAAVEANGVITPKNLERMRAGEMPLVLFGPYEGKEIKVLTERDPHSPPEIEGVTYRLLPEPLLEAFEKRVADLSSRFPGIYKNGPPPYVSSNGVSIDRTNPFGKPGIGSFPGMSDPGWATPSFTLGGTGGQTPGWPRNSSAAPYITLPIIVDVKLGEAPKVPAIAGDNAPRVFVNSVDKVNGVKFSVVDADVDPLHKLVDVHADTKYYVAKWVEEPIPGTVNKGTFLIAIGRVRYYLSSIDPGNHRYRIIICSFPLPAGVDPPPEPELDPDNGN